MISPWQTHSIPVSIICKRSRGSRSGTSGKDRPNRLYWGLETYARIKRSKHFASSMLQSSVKSGDETPSPLARADVQVTGSACPPRKRLVVRRRVGDQCQNAIHRAKGLAIADDARRDGGAPPGSCPVPARGRARSCGNRSLHSPRKRAHREPRSWSPSRNGKHRSARPILRSPGKPTARRRAARSRPPAPPPTGPSAAAGSTG